MEFLGETYSQYGLPQVFLNLFIRGFEGFRPWATSKNRLKHLIPIFIRPVYWIVFVMGSLLQAFKLISTSQVNSNAGYMFGLKGIDIGISHSRYKLARETPTNPLFL